MKKQFQSKSVPRGTRTIWRYLGALFLLFTFAIGNVWGELTAHTPGVYEKTTDKGGYGCTLTTVASGANAGTFEVYYFSANSKYGNTTDVYGGGSKQQYRIMCADNNSEYQLINTNGTSAFTKSCDWIEMAYTTTGFSKSDYTYSSAFNEFFATAPNGGNTSNTKTCFIKPKEGDVLTLKVSGYVEFAILGADNGSSKYMTITVDGGTPTSWKSNTLSRRSVELTTGEHTIVVANVGNSANNLYGFSLKLPAATKHHVTYNLNGATGTTPTQADVAEGAKFTLHNGKTGITAPTNKDFDGWHDGKTKYAGGAEYTMGTSDVELTAQWKDHVANYTVIYKDGATELGSETVEVGHHPTGSEIAAPTKDCYTFAAWSPALSSVSGTDGQVVNVNATWTPIYSSSATLISDAVVSGKPNVNTVFAASNIVSSITFTSGNYEFTSNETKPGYYGYKDKASGDYMKILVKQGKRAQVLFGNLGADPTITVNGVAKSLDAARTTGDMAENTFTWTASAEDALISITMGSGTNTLKKIDIYSLYNATYTTSKSSVDPTSASNVTEVTLPTPSETTVGGYSFTGWVANQTVYDGETPKTAGEALNAGGTYTLTATTAFTAQWVQLYAVTYDNNGGDGIMTDSNSPYAEGAEVTLLDNTFTAPTNKIFGSWVATYNDGTEKTLTITDGKFTMPAFPVTVTAQWVDDNKVAKIGDNYYESLVAAVAAAQDNDVIYLLRNAQGGGLKINKSITIDFGGFTYSVGDPAVGSTGTETLAVQLLAGNNITFQNGTLDVYSGATCNIYRLIQNYSNLTLTNMTLDGTNITYSNPVYAWTLTTCNGTVTLGENTHIIAKAGGSALYVCAASYNAYPNGTQVTMGNNVTIDGNIQYGKWTATSTITDASATTLTITGGTVNGEFILNTTGEDLAAAANATINVSGGVFNHPVPEAYCADGYAPKDNGDNTYGVKPLAQTFSLEDLVTAQGTGANYTTYLNNLGWTVANADALDNLNTDKDYDNYPYLGLKFKNAAGYVAGEVEGGKLLTLKLGHMAGVAHLMVDDVKKMELDGVDAETPKVHYYYVENTANVKLLMANAGSKQTCVLKAITVADPFTVTFDANGGEDVASLNGTPSVTLPSATKGTDSFLGWFDAAEGGNKIGEAGASYTPTSDIELFAHWEAVSTDARLASITFSATGTLSPAFDPEVTNYTYTMPYGTAAIPTITGATSVNAKAKAPVIDAQAANWGDVAHIHGVAQSDDTKDYYITILQAPKDGVCIVWADATGNNAMTVDANKSLFVATAAADNTKKTSEYGGKTGYKLNSRPAHMSVTLSEETFQAGDVVEVFVTSVVDNSGANDKMRVFTANDVTKMLVEGDADMVQGANRLTLPETTTNALYLVRGSENADYDMWNPYVAYIAVYRPMMPELTAITINGEACVKGTGNAYTITLPEEGTDLAALTVVPTVIRNAAHATTPEAVISNSGAWVEGANTYRVMDKDGDYTDYTITITLQGQAPAPDITTQPAEVAYCAGSEPTLTVEATGNELHYAWFKKAGETDEAVGTDADSYTIASAGTYYVVVTNHVDGKLDASVTSTNAVVTLNVAAAITTQPTNKRDVVAGSEVTLSVVATNATGYQWYSCDDAEKANASAISGADAANYVFNCSANAFYYCVVGNACGADIESNVVSVKLEPVGCNVLDGTIPSAAPYIYDNGEWTLYAVTSGGKLDGTSRFDDDAEDFDGNTVNAITYGRVGMTFAKDVESLTIYATSSSSDRAISSIKVTTDDVTTGTLSYSDVTFTASAEKLGKKDSSSPYRFVLEANNMLLEAGKKYWLQFSGTVSAFKICYSEALAMPKLPTLGNQELCAGAAYETFDASITNAADCEGTVSYEWYETLDTENPVAITASYTPDADGTYYVVVKHAAAGHATRVAQSANLTVAHFAAPALESYSEDVFQHMGTEATLSVTATGSGLAYAWYTCDAEGNNADAITGAATASYAIASIAEGVQYYKVVISNNCDATTLLHIFKVEGWNQLEQVDVTATTTWDMANVSASAINLKNDDPALDKQNARLLLANIDGVNNTTFNAQALKFEGQHIGRTDANVKHLAGRYVQFNVTVPGAVFVTFASNGNNARTIRINDKKCTRTTAGTAADKYITYALAVEPGSVEIMGMQGDEENQYVRISRIEFKAEDNYHRPVNPAYLGTLCWTNNAVLGGATLYEFAGKNEYNYLVFDEVAENRLEAGKPYIFMPENGNTLIKVYNTDGDEPKTESDLQPVNHMYGTFTGKTLVPGEDDNMYYFSASHIWAVKDFVVNINVPAYYCYVDYEAVLAAEPAPAPAPGRRRVTMGVQGQQVATGIEDVQGDKVQCTKMLINGQLFILRGEKMYDAKGQLVK